MSQKPGPPLAGFSDGPTELACRAEADVSVVAVVSVVLVVLLRVFAPRAKSSISRLRGFAETRSLLLRRCERSGSMDEELRRVSH